jgi:hypothetical protein
MGKIFTKLKIRGQKTIYGNKDACRQCPNRCTAGKSPKTICFSPNTKYIPVKMYGSIKFELDKIPDDFIQTTPYNSFNRKDEIKKKVVLRIKEDVINMKDRMCF